MPRRNLDIFDDVDDVMTSSRPRRHHKQVRHKRAMRQVKHERTVALMQDILDKLGRTEIPRMTSPLNMTLEEVRQEKREFEEELRHDERHSHVLFDEDEYDAKHLHQINFSGNSIPLNTFSQVFFEKPLPHFSPPSIYATGVDNQGWILHTLSVKYM